MLNISEKLRVSGEMSRSPDDHIWAKMQFWSYNIILMYQVVIFSIKKIFVWGIVNQFWKFEVQRSRLPWPNMRKMQFLEPQLCSNTPGGNFCESEKLIGGLSSISENLRSKRSEVTSLNAGKTQRSKEIVDYIGGFSGANVWPRHIESTYRRRHPMVASESSSVWFIS